MSDSLRPYGLSLPDSSVHGILQARVLEWVAMLASRGSSPPRDETQVSYPALAAGFFTTSDSWEASSTAYTFKKNIYLAVVGLSFGSWDLPGRSRASL